MLGLFGRESVGNALRLENAMMRKQLQKISAERTKIRDMAARIAIGIPASTPAGSAEGALERLRVLTAYRENLELRARIARDEAEMEAESQRLEQGIARMEQQLQEPLSLQLLAPTAGQQVKRGATLDIQWSFTGPIGARLRIGLLKNRVLFSAISYGASTDAGTFSWQQVPTNLPQANDYQVSLQDPTSGLSVVSDNFQIQ